MESAKLIGALTREHGDVGLAEELAQDALVAALERCPATVRMILPELITKEPLGPAVRQDDAQWFGAELLCVEVMMKPDQQGLVAVRFFGKHREQGQRRGIAGVSIVRKREAFAAGIFDNKIVAGTADGAEADQCHGMAIAQR